VFQDLGVSAGTGKRKDDTRYDTLTTLEDRATMFQGIRKPAARRRLRSDEKFPLFKHANDHWAKNDQDRLVYVKTD